MLEHQGLLDEVGVVEIDPAVSDTAASTEAFGLDPEMLANCVVVGGKREGDRAPGRVRGPLDHSGGRERDRSPLSRRPQGLVPAHGAGRGADRHGVRGHHADRPPAGLACTRRPPRDRAPGRGYWLGSAAVKDPAPRPAFPAAPGVTILDGLGIGEPAEQTEEVGPSLSRLKLGLQLGYWGAAPPGDAGELVAEAERLGYDSVWTAEAYGSDALTPLAWWGSRTSKLRLGTALCQLSASTPTATAMAAITLDHLCGGRFVLGLGVSGPQVVEGWYGQPFPKPLERTREYVSIVRKVLAREAPVTSDGPHYPLPYPGGTGFGKPLKSIVHPLRPDLPVVLGAEGPKNVALAAEIADGWFPAFFSPTLMGEFSRFLAEGFARPEARHSPTISK